MPKKRTEQRSLSARSMDKLRKEISAFGWELLPYPQEQDFGTDGAISLFTSSGESTSCWAHFQLKSTGTANLFIDLDIDDLKNWANQPLPFFVFFYSEPQDKVFWLNVHSFYHNIFVANPEKLSARTLRVPFSNVLSPDSKPIIEHIIKSLCDEASMAIKLNKARERNFSERLLQGNKIVAMGYDASNVKLDSHSLRDATMMGADFKNSSLRNADIRSASLMGADFTEADLSGADMRQAALMGAYLENANLQGADLRGTAFMGAFLKGADFRGAKLDEVAKWSLGAANDYELAKYDESVLSEVKELRKFKNYVASNLSR